MVLRRLSIRSDHNLQVGSMCASVMKESQVPEHEP